MVDVKEFAGLRPLHPETFCIKPYDVIGEQELAELRKNEESAIHMIVPSDDGDRYLNAQRAFERLRKNMVRDEPSMYLYEEANDEFRQRGFILGVSLADYEKGLIKKHEETREKPLHDRIKHIEALRAHTGLVWTVFRRNEKIKEVMNEIARDTPVFDFEKYGYRHRLWKVNDDAAIATIKSLFSDVPLYIADGHHRIAAAWHNWKKHGGKETKYAMIFAASDDEVRILPYNRVIRTLDHTRFMDRLRQKMNVEPLTDLHKPQRHEIQMYYGGTWWKLTPEHVPEGTVDSLDVSILQKQVLEPVLGITDIRKDPSIFFVGGNVSRREYERLVDEEGNAAVFYLHPTSIDELEAIADAGENMPPKSTWFDPKLLTGLVFHTFDEG